MGNTNTNTAVQAVQAFAATPAGRALATAPASHVVGAAVATGKVPGYPKHWGATAQRPAGVPRSAGTGGAAMHSLGRAYRQVPRSVGLGARANGFGNYGAQAAAQGTTTASMLHAANRKAQAAAKAGAKQAKQAPATAPQPAS